MSRRDRIVHWLAVSLAGRYLHRAIHPVTRNEACVICRHVWWGLTARSIQRHRQASDSPEKP